MELCVVTINEKTWTRAGEVCKALEYCKTIKAVDVVNHLCSKTDYAQKCLLIGFIPETKPVNWPKDSQKYDIYISEEEMYKLVFSRQRPKAKDFRRHCCHAMIPQIRWQLTNKTKEQHQHAITGCDNQIQPLEFTNEAQQHEILRLIEEIQNRYVARRGCFENRLCFIKKNSEKTHPYYVIWCQYRQLEKHKWWLELRYPNMEVADECDDPNSIH